MKKEIKQIEQLLEQIKADKKETLELEVSQPELPFKVGEAYLFRTVTLYYTGRIAQIVGKFLILDECAWIADTGRFADAIKDGTFNEVEPMGNSVRLNSDSIIDAITWSTKLPNTQK